MLVISSIKLNLTHKMTTPMTCNEIHTTTLTCTYCLRHTEIGPFKSPFSPERTQTPGWSGGGAGDLVFFWDLDPTAVKCATLAIQWL